jgi:hypothetical protein
LTLLNIYIRETLKVIERGGGAMRKIIRAIYFFPGVEGRPSIISRTVKEDSYFYQGNTVCKIHNILFFGRFPASKI